MNITPFEAPRYEKVMLPKAIDLRRVAEWAGIPVQDIQDLNPELRRWTTPVRMDEYELKVPEGTGDEIMARLTEATPDDFAALNYLTVKKGETLTTIARKLKVSKTDLAEANYLKTTARLSPGQQLIIPRAPTLLLATHTDNPAPPTENRRVDAVDASNIVTPKAEKPAQGPIVHRVKRGETLFSIAQLYRTTVASLKQWNRMKGSAIKAGQRLTIFPARGAVSTH
jgi:membrane-bound lytic murein transglycosylase D